MKNDAIQFGDTFRLVGDRGDASSQMPRLFSNQRTIEHEQRLLGDGDQLNRFVNVFVDGEDVRFLDSLDTPLKEGSEIDILLAIAGG